MRIFIIFLLPFSSLQALGDHSMSDHYETVKETCRDISSIRKEINRMNEQILQLLAERTAYVQRAGDLKSKTTRIADDRQRVIDQEKILTEQSLSLELPLEISIPTFQTIVEQSIEFQQRYIDGK